MKRGILATLVLSSCLVSMGWGQVGGSGTPNTIPQFITSTTIGDSPILLFNGNIGIGSLNPNAKFEVKDFRDLDVNGNGPNAIFGLVTCKQTPNIGCAAVRGDANAVSLGAIGVLGNNFATDAQGGGGLQGQTFATVGFSFGARGDALGTTGFVHGVVGITHSTGGSGGYFVNRAKGDVLIGVVAGPPDIRVFRVDGTGMVFADGGFRPFGADFAEEMGVSGDRSGYEPGDLLVINPTDEHHLTLSATPYSTLVAGVYSTKPGLIASQHRMDDPGPRNEVPLAVVGIVPCKVTAENGPIAAGDLLVTSSTLGRAMKGTDRARMLGAVVGKALESLREGTGTIQVLVTLQ